MASSQTDLRRFKLMRTEDISGVSGTGIVGEGVVFANGKVALSWWGPIRSVVMYDSVKDMLSIHGHRGKTAVEWIDQ